MTPKEKYALKFANLLNYVGITRADCFYRCQYNLAEIKAAAETDSYLRMAIKKYKELMFKAGYAYKGENDEAISYLLKRFRIMGYMIDEPMERVWRGVVYDLVKFSNAFLIKTRRDEIPFIKAKGITKSEKPVAGYCRVDPEQIRIQFDKEGRIKKYKQVLNNREKIFNPEDVIHFTFDRDPGSVWGVPRWIAALEDLQILRKLEGNALQLVYRFAMPFIHMIIGLTTPGFQGTKKEVEDARRDIEHSPADSMIITTERTKFEVIGTKDSFFDITPLLQYFMRRVFAALNVSESMMGLGGVKQDADSMEEQIHNAVKDNQSVFALQFQHYIINELLLEGGFNPILDENDIINLVFNEINLDTKIKLENHEINKFQSDILTFEETRRNLGIKAENIPEDRLFANMIAQQNALEQIDYNHENALEIQQLQIDANEKLARISAGAKTSSSTSTPKGNSHKATSSASYVRRNTGNGKTRKQKVTQTVRRIDAPQNQYGTFSVKVKEWKAPRREIPVVRTRIFQDELTSLLDLGIKNKLNLEALREKLITSINSHSMTFASAGAARALTDIEIPSEGTPVGFESDIVRQYSNRVISQFVNDIKEKSGNTTDENDILNYIDSIRYRLNYLGDYVGKKTYWYSYIKTLALNHVSSVKICCTEGSRHSEHSGRILSTANVNINDIPSFCANCHCYIEPILEGKEGETDILT